MSQNTAPAPLLDHPGLESAEATLHALQHELEHDRRHFAEELRQVEARCQTLEADRRETRHRLEVLERRNERSSASSALTRNNLEMLRNVANNSTRQAIQRHYWRTHRSTIFLNLVLLVVALVVFGISWQKHGFVRDRFGGLTAGAGAIAAITLASVAYTIDRGLRKTRPAGRNDGFSGEPDEDFPANAGAAGPNAAKV